VAMTRTDSHGMLRIPVTQVSLMRGST